MLKWQVSEYDLKSLALVEAPIPKPGLHQLLVRVGAVSLNYRDKLALDGEFGRHHELPIVPASDGSGTVVEVGTAVQRFRVGDRVTSIFAPKWLYGKTRGLSESAMLGVPLPGVLAEYILLDDEGAVATPAYLSDAEASTLPIAAVTAWSALFERCNMSPGETVLVQGTGGVSLFALQIAKAAGAYVIITSSSDEKLKRAIGLGADDIINYKKHPEWGAVARSLTGGLGVDHVLDVAGGESVRQSLKAARTGGNVVIVGLLESPQFTIDILPFILQQGAIHALSVGSRDAFEKMNRALETSRILPVIDKEYAFTDSAKAFQRLDEGPFGKIVIRVHDEAIGG
jgi:NADPH:quinone reductase-like Zn-dependent oxidoreductase